MYRYDGRNNDDVLDRSAIIPVADQARLTDVLEQAGFTSIRRVSETATNMILEAQPGTLAFTDGTENDV